MKGPSGRLDLMSTGKLILECFLSLVIVTLIVVDFNFYDVHGDSTKLIRGITALNLYMYGYLLMRYSDSARTWFLLPMILCALCYGFFLLMGMGLMGPKVTLKEMFFP